MQGCYARFGGGVVGEARGAGDAEDAGDGDDCAVAGADHTGEEGFESVEVGEEVDGDAALDLVDACVEEGAAVYDTGVVDQDRWGAELVWLAGTICGGGLGELTSRSICAATFATCSASPTSHL